MSQRKTQLTNESVDIFIDSIEDESRRKDCRAIAEMMKEATGQEPRMWGPSIIGFGKRHYRYANGKPAELCKVGFAPRSRSFAFYLAKFPGKPELMEKLGKYSHSGGCLHLRKLTDIDTEVLKRIIQGAYQVGDGEESLGNK